MASCERYTATAQAFASSRCDSPVALSVDVVVPVLNSDATIVETIESAICQIVPEHLCLFFQHFSVAITVCCFDDGSTDDSWSLLCQLRDKFGGKRDVASNAIPSKIRIARSADGVARGAGYARNRAVSLGETSHATSDNCFLCLLDSDDVMYPTRVAEQLHTMISLDKNQRRRTILGCKFDREPADSTWHYANWANGLTDARLSLERFREVTVLQPTWMMARSRFHFLGGYIESPHPSRENFSATLLSSLMDSSNGVLPLVHPTCETRETLRLAEDLRFFHSHVAADGLLRLCRSDIALVTYRHRAGMSQSSQTPRKLLFQLRVLAFESTVLVDPMWKSFVVWGAGRDGKDFVKMLSPKGRQRVVCMVDVDEKKINAGYYANRECAVRIPIVHFSLLASDPIMRRQLVRAWEAGLDKTEHQSFGRIDKSRPDNVETCIGSCDSALVTIAEPPKKRRPVCCRSVDVDLDQLQLLPVVVCVAMYRTNGALERNVNSIGRTEGQDLWHFC